MKIQNLNCPTELLSPTLMRNEIVQQQQQDHGTGMQLLLPKPGPSSPSPAGVRIEALRAGSVSVCMENLILLSLVEEKALNLKLIY